MKKILIGFMFGVMVVLCMAAVRAQVGSELCTPNFTWNTTASFLNAGTEATALAVGERTYKTVTAAIAAAASGGGNEGDEEIVIYNIPYGTNGLRFRAIGFTNDGTVKVDIHTGTYDGGTEDCELALRGTLTFTIGTQASTTASYEMARAVVLAGSSDVSSTSDWTIATAGAAESIAEAMLDLQGDDILVLVPIEGSLTANAKILTKPY